MPRSFAALLPPAVALYGAGSVLPAGAATPGHVTITPVYWEPAGHALSSTYKSIVNGYLQNVALASGQTTNVFSVEAA